MPQPCCLRALFDGSDALPMLLPDEYLQPYPEAPCVIPHRVKSNQLKLLAEMISDFPIERVRCTHHFIHCCLVLLRANRNHVKPFSIWWDPFIEYFPLARFTTEIPAAYKQPNRVQRCNYFFFFRRHLVLGFILHPDHPPPLVKAICVLYRTARAVCALEDR
jgi:hypothetical protein